MTGKIRGMIFKHSSLCFIMSLTVLAQSIAPGVSPGDSFTYSFTAFWDSTSYVEPPANITALNETKLIKITVTEICGVVVMMNLTRYFKNGTQTNSQIFVNLLNGIGEGFGLIIAPNLSPKSMAYPLGLNYSNSFILNEAIVKEYPFGEREVLHASLSKDGISYDMYFDKKTGVMFEWYIERSLPEGKVLLQWKIQEFNVKSEEYQGDEETGFSHLGGLAVLISVVLIIGISLIILVSKRSRKRRRRSRLLRASTLLEFCF